MISKLIIFFYGSGYLYSKQQSHPPYTPLECGLQSRSTGLWVLRGEMACKTAQKSLIYSFLNTRALTQALMGFVVYSKVCGMRCSVMALTILYGKTSHIVLNLKYKEVALWLH